VEYVSVLGDPSLLRPARDPQWPDEHVIAVHRAIVRSRTIDKFVAGLQARGLVSFFVPAHGHEAHIYGALLALKASDWVFADHRQSAAALYRGLDLSAWLAMLLGVRASATKGHALPIEMTARAQNLVSVSSPLGTQIIHCSGTAQGMKVRRTADVAFCWFGAAAAAAGDCHVGLNFAGVYKVPAIFYFCASQDRAADVARLGDAPFIDRAEGYGLRAVQVDGSDPFAVYTAVTEAAAYARRGGGATLIEGLTGGPDGTADPLDRVERFLAARGIDGKPLREVAAQKLRGELERGVAALRAGGQPDTDALFDDVFAEPSPALREQRAYQQEIDGRFASSAVDL
jgi:2-oxoisovalerate dehydrogenase E1 component alpha subunit